MTVRSWLAVLLGVWTAYWLAAGRAHMRAESVVVQNGFGGDGVQMWELFDLQMVALYPLLRWLPVAALLLGGWFWVRRRERRSPEETVASTTEETSLAA
jgi:hypothetical protein